MEREAFGEAAEQFRRAFFLEPHFKTLELCADNGSSFHCHRHYRRAQFLMASLLAA
jgi:hypothetical protein